MLKLLVPNYNNILPCTILSTERYLPSTQPLRGTSLIKSVHCKIKLRYMYTLLLIILVTKKKVDKKIGDANVF